MSDERDTEDPTPDAHPSARPESGSEAGNAGNAASAASAGNAENAATRRAARKKARLNAPVPQRDPAFASVPLQELRAMRDALAEEETRVSYWRRIVQARIDVIRAQAGHDPVADLGRLLADAQSSHRRLAHISVEPVEGLPPLPDLARLWAAEAGADEPEAREELLTALGEAESRLSEYRGELFRRIDRVTGELIARYREDPTLALSALPTDEDRP